MRDTKPPEWKEGASDAQNIEKCIKRAWGPHKREIWSLPADAHAAIVGTLENKFRTLFKLLNARGTRGVVREFVGHGVGRDMHEAPNVPNFVDKSAKNQDFVLVPGMTIAVEPMVTIGRPEVDFRDKDRWTVITKDRSLAAHYEHTVAVTAEGVDVLTDGR